MYVPKEAQLGRRSWKEERWKPSYGEQVLNTFLRGIISDDWRNKHLARDRIEDV